MDAWRQVGRLHRAGIAHRALGLGRFTITPDGRAVLDGFDDARVAAPERDLARDTAQLLVATAVSWAAGPAVDAAVDALGPDARRAEALPYLQPLALPGATRRALRDDRDLLADLRARVQDVTGAAPAALARLERIRPRTLVSIVAFAVAFYVLLPQLADVQRTADAAAEAELAAGCVPAVPASAATYVFAAVAHGRARCPQPIPFWADAADAGGVVVRRPHRPGQHRRPGRGRALPAAGRGPAGGGRHRRWGSTWWPGFVDPRGAAGRASWPGPAPGAWAGFSLPDASTVLLVVAVVLAASGLVIVLVPSLRRRVLPSAGGAGPHGGWGRWPTW